jgi:hypothetical protein
VTANVGLYLEKHGNLEMAAVLYDRAKVNYIIFRNRRPSVKKNMSEKSRF